MGAADSRRSSWRGLAALWRPGRSAPNLAANTRRKASMTGSRGFARGSIVPRDGRWSRAWRKRGWCAFAARKGRQRAEREREGSVRRHRDRRRCRRADVRADRGTARPQSAAAGSSRQGRRQNPDLRRRALQFHQPALRPERFLSPAPSTIASIATPHDFIALGNAIASTYEKPLFHCSAPSLRCDRALRCRMRVGQSMFASSTALRIFARLNSVETVKGPSAASPWGDRRL